MSKITLVFLALLNLWCSPRALSGDTQAPVYTVNLDLPPEERWTEIMKTYAPLVEELAQGVAKKLPKIAVDAVNIIGSDLDKYLPDPYAGEIRGISKCTNVTVGELLLANLLYELTAYRRSDNKACTSIVAESEPGTIFHGRNLDYSLENAVLKKATAVVHFQSKGVTQYSGTTFIGYVGLLTGQKPNKFTISLDERDKGEPWENVVAGLLSGSHGIVSWHIRNALADPSSDYVSALEHLSSVTLITPSYVIIGGAEPTQGAVITRDRLAALDVWKLAPLSGQWYVLETNYDHWGPPPADDDRRDPGMKAMNSTGRAAISPDTLFTVLSTPPVLNDGTTYTNIMSAATPDLYHAVIRNTN